MFLMHPHAFQLGSEATVDPPPVAPSRGIRIANSAASVTESSTWLSKLDLHVNYACVSQPRAQDTDRSNDSLDAVAALSHAESLQSVPGN